MKRPIIIQKSQPKPRAATDSHLRLALQMSEPFTVGYVHAKLICPLAEDLERGFGGLRNNCPNKSGSIYRALNNYRAEFQNLGINPRDWNPKILESAAQLIGATKTLGEWAHSIRRLSAINAVAIARHHIWSDVPNVSVDERSWNAAGLILRGAEFDRDAAQWIFILGDFLRKMVAWELVWKFEFAINNRESTAKVPVAEIIE